jgi:diguanylate cyclase (GGDEF)-like protein
VTDEVTGLPDSTRLRELLEDEVERAERYGHELSLVLMSVDDLRRIGERNGSSQADEVLREVARVLDESSHGVGKPGQWGTEELAVVLPETAVAGALELAERVRTAIREARIPLAGRSGTMSVTASLGVAALARFGGSADGLTAAASAASRGHRGVRARHRAVLTRGGALERRLAPPARRARPSVQLPARSSSSRGWLPIDNLDAPGRHKVEWGPYEGRSHLPCGRRSDGRAGRGGHGCRAHPRRRGCVQGSARRPPGTQRGFGVRRTRWGGPGFAHLSCAPADAGRDGRVPAWRRRGRPHASRRGCG